MHMPLAKLSSLILLLVATLSCQGTRVAADPVLELRGGSGASELGVSTDFGVVFLGRTSRSGAVELTAWYGDGPSIEFSVIEPLGGGLFTAEPQIKLPRVPISFRTPRAGETLRVIGRSGRERWSADVTVRAEPQLEGLIVDVPAQVLERDGQAGAGLYRIGEKEHDLKLVGLVTGTVEVTGSDGATRRYLAAVGPDQLWRLVTYKRDFPRKRKWVYRADVL
ncbi:MAG: hypothetical protein JNN27_21545 [Planctomycetes bacterium]|nr:hypothetical protein [Planctomycetota bacterium]